MKGHRVRQHPHPSMASGGRGAPGVTLHAPCSGRAGTPLSWPLRRGPSEPPSLQAPPVIAHCAPCVGSGRGAAGLSETAYVSETTVTGTVPWQKATPCSLAQGHRQGRRETRPGSSRLHGRQEGPGGHPPPDPWGRVTSPRGESSPQDCSSWVRGQEPFLIAYFQSWQSQPDPNMSNGLPHWLPPQMAHPLSCSVVPWTPRPEGASVPQLTAHQAGIAQYRDPTPSA